MTTALPITSAMRTTDPLALTDIDSVRMYVGNAKQAAYFYAHTFGFKIEQYSDLTTGSRSEASYLLRQGNIRLILTSGLHEEHPACQEVARFGDGVKDIAFTVRDAALSWQQAVKNGAISEHEPIQVTDATGTVTTAAIRTFGRCIHTFVSRRGGYELSKVKAGGVFMPSYARAKEFTLNQFNIEHPCGLECLDHCVCRGLAR